MHDLLLITKITIKRSCHVTFLRYFQIFKSTFIFLICYIAQEILTFSAFENISVVFYRSWQDEFSGVVTIFISCKVLEKNGMKDFKINTHLIEMLHFLPLHAFLKAMSKDGEGFHYLRQIFPRITDAKSMGDGRHFGSPKIRQCYQRQAIRKFCLKSIQGCYREFS